ncbi:unnamed protein product [Closterium sp. Naga37s-1]|nr:unnamed protein product [Closterium sp. Naga37s-1]
MALAQIGSLRPCSRPYESVFISASNSRDSSFRRPTSTTPLVPRSSNRPHAVNPSSRGLEFHCLRVTAISAAAKSVETSTDNCLVDHFATDDRPIVLYDGVCNMCNGGVNFALDAYPQGRLRFAALQSEAGRSLLARSGRSPEDISSIVLVERDGAYIKSDAVLRIARLLDLPYPPLAFLASLAPKPLRDVVEQDISIPPSSPPVKASSCTGISPAHRASLAHWPSAAICP